jgi:hypothetical protein
MERTKALEIKKPKPQEYFSACGNKENFNNNTTELYKQITLDKLNFKK